VADEEVRIEWTSDDAAILAAVEKVEGRIATMAKSSASEIDKVNKAFKGIGGAAEEAGKKVSGAGKKVNDSNKKTASSLKKLAEVGGDGERALIGVADAMERAGLESAETATRIAADLGGALEGILKGGEGVTGVLGRIAPAAGLVGVGIGVMAASWYTANKALDDANAKLERNRQELADTVDWTNKVSAAKLAAALASGELTQETFNEQVAAARAGEVFDERIQSSRDNVGELERQLADARTELDKVGPAFENAAKASANIDYDTQIGGMRSYTQASNDAALTTNKQADEVQSLSQQLVSAKGELSRLVGAQENYEGLLADTSNIKHYRSEQEKLTKEVEKLANAEAAAVEQLSRITQAANAQAVDADEAIISARGIQLNQINDLAMKTEELAAVEAARAAVNAKAERELADLVESLEADRAQRRARLEVEQERQHQREMARRQREVEAGVDGISNILGAYASLDTASEDMFNAQKVAAISQVTIDGAVAIVKALATLGPVAGALASAGIVATSAASIANIASQSYEPANIESMHVGGTLGSSGTAPDEVRLIALQNEMGGLLTTQGQRAAGGAEGVNRLNSGMSAGGDTISVVQMGHRTVSTATSRSVDRGGRLAQLVAGRDPRRAHHRST